MPRSMAGLGLLLPVLFLGQAVAATEGTSAVELAYAEAQSAVALRDCPAAVGHLKRVLLTWPERTDVHQQTGDCLLKLGRPSEALEHYREWARLAPGDEDARQAVARAEARLRALEDRRLTRAKERDAARRLSYRHPSSLASVARDVGRDREKSSRAYTVAESGEIVPSDLMAAVGKRMFLLDTMRERAEAVLRPAMRANADHARTLSATRRRYEEACRGKTTPAARAAESSGLRRRWSQWATVDREPLESTRPEAQTEECRALATDIARLSETMASLLSGCEVELTKAPVVYRGIREEVFARLEEELW